MRHPCKGHDMGCLWLLLLKPNTGGEIETGYCHTGISYLGISTTTAAAAAATTAMAPTAIFIIVVVFIVIIIVVIVVVVIIVIIISVMCGSASVQHSSGYFNLQELCMPRVKRSSSYLAEYPAMADASVGSESFFKWRHHITN